MPHNGQMYRYTCIMYVYIIPYAWYILYILYYCIIRYANIVVMEHLRQCLNEHYPTSNFSLTD